MKRQYSTKLATTQAQDSHLPCHETMETHSYQVPQITVVGKAVNLVQQNISGQLRDGTGGWYVWGS